MPAIQYGIILVNKLDNYHCELDITNSIQSEITSETFCWCRYSVKYRARLQSGIIVNTVNVKTIQCVGEIMVDGSSAYWHCFSFYCDCRWLSSSAVFITLVYKWYGSYNIFRRRHNKSESLIHKWALQFISDHTATSCHWEELLYDGVTIPLCHDAGNKPSNFNLSKSCKCMHSHLNSSYVIVFIHVSNMISHMAKSVYSISVCCYCFIKSNSAVQLYLIIVHVPPNLTWWWITMGIQRDIFKCTCLFAILFWKKEKIKGSLFSGGKNKIYVPHTSFSLVRQWAFRTWEFPLTCEALPPL